MMKTIVVTGAAGNLGRKLTAHLAKAGGYHLRLLDRAGDPACAIEAADLGCLTTDWTRHLAGADVIVHLAANPDASARWDRLVGPNVDGVLNLYLAAAKAGVSRIVLASSVWVLNGYRFRDLPFETTLPPDPGANPYGATKLFGERAGKAFYEAHGISTIAVRLGSCTPEQAAPEHVQGGSIWSQDCWLSDRDMCLGMEAAINTTVKGYEIINLTSANPASTWDLRPAAALGFHPRDTHVTRQGWRQAARTAMVSVGRHKLPRLIDRFIPLYW